MSFIKLLSQLEPSLELRASQVKPAFELAGTARLDGPCCTAIRKKTGSLAVAEARVSEAIITELLPLPRVLQERHLSVDA